MGAGASVTEVITEVDEFMPCYLLPKHFTFSIRSPVGIFYPIFNLSSRKWNLTLSFRTNEEILD